ncbi:MAG: hypothetical protein D6794_06870 [Deltaproteobacteria bacterium]|nr:MAG: hypothetical protein D6794_06870 [Deltaproteobacteria bacterium]
MNADFLLTVLSAAAALLFFYVPGLRRWFGRFSAEEKRGIMALLLAVLTAGYYALYCSGALAGLDAPAAPCGDTARVVWMYLQALGGNQAAYWSAKAGERWLSGEEGEDVRG